MKSLMETLWAKLAFWKTKPLKEGVDFVFHDFEDSDLTGIVILKGDYAGVVYYYTNANIAEEGMIARLKFGYQIVNSNEYGRDYLEKDEKFVTMIGDILTQIILTEDQIESSRTIYSEKSSI